MSRFGFAIGLASLFGACVPDDWNGLPYTGPGEGTVVVDTDEPALDAAIVGQWISEGEDLSTLFSSATFKYQKVDAQFRGNGTYLVVATDSEGTTYPLQGTYSVDDSDEPSSISLTQTSPYAAEASGLWAVDGDELTYEVVQTEPDYGYVPPSGEFGTTTGPGLAAGENVQTYRSAE